MPIVTTKPVASGPGTPGTASAGCWAGPSGKTDPCALNRLNLTCCVLPSGWMGSWVNWNSRLRRPGLSPPAGLPWEIPWDTGINALSRGWAARNVSNRCPTSTSMANCNLTWKPCNNTPEKETACIGVPSPTACTARIPRYLMHSSMKTRISTLTWITGGCSTTSLPIAS